MRTEHLTKKNQCASFLTSIKMDNVTNSPLPLWRARDTQRWLSVVPWSWSTLQSRGLAVSRLSSGSIRGNCGCTCPAGGYGGPGFKTASTLHGSGGTSDGGGRSTTGPIKDWRRPAGPTQQVGSFFSAVGLACRRVLALVRWFFPVFQRPNREGEEPRRFFFG